MIKEIVTETAIVDLDNYAEEIERIETYLYIMFKSIGFKVYRLNTYLIDQKTKTITCSWWILPDSTSKTH
jgi:hypothetical protein